MNLMKKYIEQMLSPAVISSFFGR